MAKRDKAAYVIMEQEALKEAASQIIIMYLVVFLGTFSNWKQT